MMKSAPRDMIPDSTLALLLQGYDFIRRRCDRYKNDVFETRLMFRKFVCMRGEEAARIFYDNDLFERRDSLPHRVRQTLIGTGGIQLLDGEAHRARKAMFMSLMGPADIGRLANIAADEWDRALDDWENRSTVVLFPEVQKIMCRTACKWTGVPLFEAEVRSRTRDFALMIDSPAALGLRHWRGRRARSRVEKWVGSLIEQKRDGSLPAREDRAISVIAGYRDPGGTQLDQKSAAVELINLLRPIVAVARFVVFAGAALHDHPDWAEKIRAGNEEALELFVQEVRRFYPFFPFVEAVVRKPFAWKGYAFPRGRRVLLDLYGTDHDQRTWKDPETFRPSRFLDWKESPFNFIPQGGGDHYTSHRCAGEWITIELMKFSVRFLCRSMLYDVPRQDLSIKLSRIPAIPKSMFVLHNIKRTGAGKMPLEKAA